MGPMMVVLATGHPLKKHSAELFPEDAVDYEVHRTAKRKSRLQTFTELPRKKIVNFKELPRKQKIGDFVVHGAARKRKRKK